MHYTIYPKPLNGVINASSSKSIMHRALICAAFCDSSTTFYSPLLCEDTILTIKALETIGVSFRYDHSVLTVIPPKTYITPAKPIECGNSGSTLRFLIPVLGSLFPSVAFHGTTTLISRINKKDLQSLPLSYVYYDETITISNYENFDEITLYDDNTTQFISGIILNCAIKGLTTTIHIISSTDELNDYIQLTLDVIEKFGSNYIVKKNANNYTIILNETFKHQTFKISHQSFHGIDFFVEGDFSSSANFLAMGLLGNKVIVKNLCKDSHQPDRAFIEIIKQMNGTLEIGSNAISATSSDLIAASIDVSRFPDIAPLLMAICSVAEGTSTITNYQKLAYKESNRITETIRILKSLGADIKEKNNQIIIKGKEKLEGGVIIDPAFDHRLIMMVVALTNRLLKRVTILNANCVNKSYPYFWEDYRKINGIAIEENLDSQGEFQYDKSSD